MKSCSSDTHAIDQHGRRCWHSFCVWALLTFTFPGWAADAQKFDQLIEQADAGQLQFTNRQALRDFVSQLQAFLPPNDRKRELRLQREICISDYIDAPDQGISFASQFIERADLQSDPLNLSHFYLCRAQHYNSKNQVAAQEADTVQALLLAEQSEDLLTKAWVTESSAELHSSRGEYAEALIRLFQADQIYQQLKHRVGRGTTLEAIAAAYRRMGDYSKSIEYLELSEKEFSLPGDQYRRGILLQQKGFVYGEMGKPEVARQLFQQVRQIYQKAGEVRFVNAIDIDMMWISNLQQRYSESLELAAQVTQQLQRMENAGAGLQVVNQGLFYLYRAEALSETGQQEAALAGFLQAQQQLEALDNPRYLLWLYQAWSKALAKAQQHDKAYELLVKATELQQHLQSQSKQQREALLRYQFDTALQDEKNSQLQAENALSTKQLQTLEAAQRWQYIALALFILLALIALSYAISQIKRNRQLHQLAMTDELTQVANRRSILWYANQTRQKAIEEKRCWSLLLMDIDHFKQCNDQYGHDTGDVVLVTIANTLKHLLRSSDRIGRSGGEEFLVVLPDTSQQDAAEIAERLCQAVAAVRFAEIPQLQITISIGVTQAGWQEEVREVVSRADAGLYQAKHAGRNQVKVN